MTESARDFLTALQPIVESLGARLVPPDGGRPGDRAVEWQGRTVAHVRTTELHGALDRLVQSVEDEVGAPLAHMSRDQKQIAVRRLAEQGAFLLRGAVEDLATRMDVSKVTLYNYLNAISRTGH